MEQEELFHWKCEPKAEAWLEEAIAELSRGNDAIHQFAHILETHTSTCLFDWIDHIVVSFTPQRRQQLVEAGFTIVQATVDGSVWRHLGAQLPSVVVKESGLGNGAVAVRVDSIADFLMVRGLYAAIEGSPFSGYRRCCICSQSGISFYVVERRATHTFLPTYADADYLLRYFAAQELWLGRQRDMADEQEAMSHTLHLAEKMASTVGAHLAASIVLEAERRYWQVRNSAGQLQKNRQDSQGMGWANHDHHTFRSSRRHFSSLVRLFEILGFHCRERFYAGQEAGWGAQVMENSLAGLILFLDVDLAPHEVEIDFAHQPLPELESLGTIGLWCALHGDSILKAGMHHLEAQFLFNRLTEDLSHQGVRMMEPFSNFPYLKQAFTAGEVWLVEGVRIDKLLHAGLITREQAERFRAHGAVGSHLENLQRREGYKGFNQKNVSYIIKKTDPRIEA